MKMCRECKQEKQMHEFYAHKRMADGHLNKCIECVKKRIRLHRKANPDKYKKYEKSRSCLPNRIASRKKYWSSDKGKNTRKRASINFRLKYPLRYAANVLTQQALRRGDLRHALFCEACGSNEKLEAHHDDYTKPLQVTWLCSKCHQAWHRHNTPIYE